MYICWCVTEIGKFVFQLVKPNDNETSYKTVVCLHMLKVKVKATQEQATKAQMGRTGIALLFL